MLLFYPIERWSGAGYHQIDFEAHGGRVEASWHPRRIRFIYGGRFVSRKAKPASLDKNAVAGQKK
ncbi:MAG: hypothetical protein WBX11_08995 [Thiobacillaceae bacterium]